MMTFDLQGIALGVPRDRAFTYIADPAKLITSFMQARCGLVNRANVCRCRRRVGPAIALGRVVPSDFLFASSREQARRFPQVLDDIHRLEESRRAAALYRSHPDLLRPLNSCAGSAT